MPPFCRPGPTPSRAARSPLSWDARALEPPGAAAFSSPHQSRVQGSPMADGRPVHPHTSAHPPFISTSPCVSWYQSSTLSRHFT